VEQYRKSGVFDFLGCCFRYCRGISLLSRQSPEIYRHAAHRFPQQKGTNRMHTITLLPIRESTFSAAC
jgi:hypothetical protein